jgi:outer membrane cobalamin receptor
VREIRFAGAAALVLAAMMPIGVAPAQETAKKKSSESTDPVRTVVTVTARPAPVTSSAADITFVSGETARAARPQSVADLLRFQPALYVGQAGRRGGLTTVSLRGGDPNFTLLLIDGIPVNDITDQLGGTVDLAAILPMNLASVEVVRGPMSAIYGSEAIAGVINVITQHAEQPRWTVRVAGGSFGTFEGAAGAAGRKGRLLYNLGVAGVRVGEQVERDSFDAVDSTARASVFLGRLTSLAFTFRGRHSGSVGFPLNSGGPRYAINRELETREITSGLGGVELRHATVRWSHQAGFDLSEQRQDQNTPTILDSIPPSFQTVPATHSDTRFRRTRLQGSSSLRIAEGWTATGGVAYRRESGENLGSIAGIGPAHYRLDRDTGAVFGETIVQRRSWSAIAGVRSDHVTGGIHRMSPRLGASALLPWSGARLRASWGRGFKMPSFYALAHPFIGNPDLRPEYSTAVDIGVEQALPRAFGVVGVNVFRSTYTNLVDFSPQMFRLVNRSRAISRGADVSWRLRLPSRLNLQTHATYTSIRLEDSPEPLRDRPRWRTGAILSKRIGDRTDLHAEGVWVSSRYDFQAPVPERGRAPSYFIANVAAGRRVSDVVSAFVRIDNVLNRQFEEYIGFVNPGIQVRAGLEFVLR